MQTFKWSRRFAAFSVVTGLAALSATAAVHAAPAKAGNASRVYIVQMNQLPVAAYTGGIKGYAATKPLKGQKIDPNGHAVVTYKAYLESQHNAMLAKVGPTRKLYSYGYVFNGMAAEMTPAQAAKLAQQRGVLAVTPDERRQMTTASTPSFLGLNAQNGFWSKTKGENIVIGIVDSGVWPEHPSFSDRTGISPSDKEGKLSYQQLPGWNGRCMVGTNFTATNCNQKLIGARYYNSGYGGNAGVAASFPYEYNSPRDAGGHGSHTASTAGGNAGVAITGAAAGFGAISGIAPRARIAVYKVCWGKGDDGGCFSSDSVAAIDQAVADGVDVINFSISGTSTNFFDPVEIAWLYAADAGVFVAASAGNSGPANATVAHPSPWVTTVAASTHNRANTGTATIGGVTYTGASSAAMAVSSLKTIYSTDAGLAGVNATALRLCFSAQDNGGTAVLDPAKVAGKIVVCDRGANARTSKSQAVKDAGGVGMILLNVTPNSLNADLHAVPTVHLADTTYTAVKAAAIAMGPGSISKSQVALTSPAPFIASFSSRGPLLAGAGNLLKPDLTAPGVDILAAVAPPGNNGNLFDLYSGTSMSGPHVAGLGALLKAAHPDWSPMAIKSALMTTGYDVLDNSLSTAARILRQGAGHVQPNKALDPGLVFDSGFLDWYKFLCAVQPFPNCVSAAAPATAATDMNVASISIGAMAGARTVTRRVTNVGGNPATYTASYTGMEGFDVTVSPSSMTIPAGATSSFTVTFLRQTAPLGVYTGGQLTQTDGLHVVRIPMLVRPVALSAPAQASGSYQVGFGYNGPFGVALRGMVAPATSTAAVATGQMVSLPVTIAPGTTYARFSLFDSDVSQASDLDLVVLFNGVAVGSSGGGTSAEEVNLANPAPGVYQVRVDGFAVPVGSATFKLFAWSLGSAPTGNLAAQAPATAVSGQVGNVNITSNGLVSGQKYLGAVDYLSVPGAAPSTIIRIDQP